MDDLRACLPTELQHPTTTITPIAAGLSGAGVYRVDAADRAFVLKVASRDSTREAWRKSRHRQELAANAGVAPRVVHVDVERRAILSDFVQDRGFFPLYGNPHTRDAAIALLGQTARRVHEIPLAPDDDLAMGGPLGLMGLLWGLLDEAGFARPAFVVAAVERELAGSPPPPERAPVMSHNDMNPTNFVYDGERVVLLDWDSAGRNDPFYDVAVIAMFLRMDDATSLALLSAYDGEPVTALPASFVYYRRVAAVLAGTAFLHLARTGGHAGARGDESLAAIPSLADFYALMREGKVSVRNADGQLAYALCLMKHASTL